MATHVKGSAIANASSYKLYLKDGTELATQTTNVSTGIDFDLSTISQLAAAGTYELGVKAISGDTTKFLDSLMSNTVSYTVAEEEEPDTSFDFTTATWLYNKYIKETTGGIGGGAASGQTGHGTYTACEAFIPVVGGTTYCLTLNGVVKKSRFWAWYTDANIDSFISGDATTVEERTAPENAKYVRISLMAPYFYTAAEQVIDENGKLTNPDPSTIKLVVAS